MFGPQKGADPDTVRVLEQRLTEWAAELTPRPDARSAMKRVQAPRAASARRLLALGGRRESGAAIIAEHTRLADDVAAAQLVITGEGRFDDQSLHGKVVSALAAGARSHHIPVLVLAGQVTLDEAALREAGIAAAFVHHRPRGIGAAGHRRRGQPAGQDWREVTAATWE